MSRAMRVEYPGAICHVMDRGDRREDIFVNDVDRQDLLDTLAERKANRILAEELSRRGWTESDLAARRHSDPGKVAVAVRQRRETTLPIKWIAARVQSGTAKEAKSVLYRLARGQHERKAARVDEPRTTRIQSMVFSGAKPITPIGS
jgi:hypothetical protein